MTDLSDIVERLHRLESENRDLRARLDEVTGRSAVDGEPQVVSRRHWLARGAAVAVGAAAGGLALAPGRAAAADGNPLLIGASNNGTNSTTINATRNTGIFDAVFGATNDSLVTGTGLFGYGSSYGTLGFSAYGTGVWGKASGDGDTSAVGTGGYIDNSASPGSAGVVGEANGVAQFGVRALSGAGTALYATSESGTAVNGYSQSGYGVYGVSDESYGGLFASPYADLGLGEGTRTAPTSDADYHFWGDVVAESNTTTQDSTLWYCVAAGTPGTWRRVAGPTTAGALTLLDAPVRVYDSRVGQAPLAVGPKTPLDNAVDRDVDCTLNSSGVPADAVGVLINLTAVNQSAGGFMSVRADGVAYSGTSNLNWVAASTTTANSCTVKCGTGAKITVRLGGSAATSNVIVDVVGYYR